MSKPSEIIELIESFADGQGDIDHWELPAEFDTFVSGEWEVDHKCEFCMDVVKHLPTGLLFAIYRCREGSYHSDYFYHNADVCLVEPVEITSIKFVAVKHD